ncbi:MAG: UDP-N-acetylmuramate--alanine ligase [Myxococcota bacterium]|jgi:UDP-N-acetylmuramate--alanine ligase
MSSSQPFTAIPPHVHLIGIGGIGVSGVARALLALGHKVSGSDVRESQLTTALRNEGATVTIGHHVDNLAGADLVVLSTAIPETNPELIGAHAQGIEVRHRSEVLGAVLDTREIAVGVIGTHGKGTVSSCITWILETAGLKPGFIIGGMLENMAKANSRLTESPYLVAEVDESDGSLTNVRPTLAVINNLEADHLNYYDSLEHVQDTVVAALNNNPRLERVFLNIDDAGALALKDRIAAPVTTFGQNIAADVRGVDAQANIDGGSFLLSAHGQDHGLLKTTLPGLYNLENALAATSVALHLSVPIAAIEKALHSFSGLENRFTVVQAGGRKIIKDYISHPTGIRRVLTAAASDNTPITAVFKPYRFTMINYLQDDYAVAFKDAHRTVITELYTAGEVPIPGIDTEFLCNKIRGQGSEVTYVQAIEDIIGHLHETVQAGEQVIFFGGDDLFQIADRYAAALTERAS